MVCLDTYIVVCLEYISAAAALFPFLPYTIPMLVQEDEALERQSEGSARSTLCSADKRREVGKGLSLADTQTGR